MGRGMRRRRYLGLVGAGVVGAAGCLGGRPATPTDSPTEHPEDGPDPPPAPAWNPPTDPTLLALDDPYESPDGWSVTLSNARVRKIALRAGTHLDPVAVPGGQNVLVDVTVEGDPNGPGTAGVLPDPGWFVVTLDGAFTVDRGGFWAGRVGRPAGYEGMVASPVLTAPADRAAVRWRAADEPVGWRLTDTHRSAVANAPAFEVREFAVPGAVEHGDGFDATLTVANVGGRDGEFLAELGATTISDTPELQFVVRAGQAVDHVEHVTPYYPADAQELRVVLNWGVDRLERTVAVQ